MDTILDQITHVDLLLDAVSVSFHDYFMHNKCDYAVSYVAGYIAGKVTKFAVVKENSVTKICEHFAETLQLSSNEVNVPERQTLIEIRLRGHLINSTL